MWCPLCGFVTKGDIDVRIRQEEVEENKEEA